MVNPTLDVGFSGQLGHSAVIMGGILLRGREGRRVLDRARFAWRGSISRARSPGQIVFNYSPVRGLPLDTSYGIEAGSPLARVRNNLLYYLLVEDDFRER